MSDVERDQQNNQGKLDRESLEIAIAIKLLFDDEPMEVQSEGTLALVFSNNELIANLIDRLARAYEAKEGRESSQWFRHGASIAALYFSDLAEAKGGSVPVITEEDVERVKTEIMTFRREGLVDSEHYVGESLVSRRMNRMRRLSDEVDPHLRIVTAEIVRDRWTKGTGDDTEDAFLHAIFLINAFFKPKGATTTGD